MRNNSPVAIINSHIADCSKKAKIKTCVDNEYGCKWV